MTHLVCARTLYGVGKDKGKTTEVSLYSPFFSEEEGNWVCPVEFSGNCVTSFAGRGIDAFQSLIVAIQGIGRRLEESNVKWSPSADITPAEDVPVYDGFPRYITSVFGGEFRRELENLMDSEVQRAHEEGRDKQYLIRAGLYRRPL